MDGSPTSSPSARVSSATDPFYEYSAPKFHDFSQPTADDSVDSWFDCQHDSEPTEVPTGEDSIGAIVPGLDISTDSDLEAQNPAAAASSSTSSVSVKTPSVGPISTFASLASATPATAMACLSLKTQLEEAVSGAPTDSQRQVVPDAQVPVPVPLQYVNVDLSAAEVKIEQKCKPSKKNNAGAVAASNKKTSDSNVPVTQTARMKANLPAVKSSSVMAASKGTVAAVAAGKENTARQKIAGKRPANGKLTAAASRAQASEDRRASLRSASTKAAKDSTNGSHSRSFSSTARFASATLRAPLRKAVQEKKETKPAPMFQPKLTMPRAPRLTTASRIKSTHLPTTEELILMDIERSKKQALALRKKNAEKVQRVLQPVGKVMPPRSTKPLTQPQEFKLFTAGRSSRRPSTAATPQPKRVAGDGGPSMSLRPRTAPPKQPRTDLMSLTKPIPFSFKTEQRVRSKSTVTPAHTPLVTPMKRITEITRDLELPTPQSTVRKVGGKLTEPISPNFATKSRVRSHQTMSTEEKEENDMMHMPKFKARKLDETILNSCGDLGVPRVPRTKPTEFAEFHLSTEDRARHRLSTPAKEENQITPFKAQPFNPKVFDEGPKGLPVVPKKPLTEPVSPNITHTQRKKDRKRKSAEMTEFKALPMPEYPPVEAVTAKKTKMVPASEPFHLLTEERGTKHVEELRMRLQQQEEEEAAKRQFRAKPMLDVSPMKPEPSTTPLTEPQPFQLRSVELSEMRRHEMMQKIQQELEQEKSMFSSFHARAAPKDEPFLVKKSDRPLTEVMDFELLSSQRAVERKKFDEEMHRRLDELEQAHKQQEEERKNRENAEVKELRQKLVHHALPVMKSKPMPLSKSEKPLTEPISPALLTDKRAALRTTKGEAVGLRTQVTDENDANTNNHKSVAAADDDMLTTF